MIPKYKLIYQDLKKKITERQYKNNDFLPSESELTNEYNCSRNTLRNSLSILAQEGFLQPIQGKGVRVIYSPDANRHNFVYHGIEPYQEELEEDEVQLKKFVNVFSEMYVNDETSQLTSIPNKTPIYYVERVRYMDAQPVIIHHSYFRKDYVEGLTKEIAEDSIYAYIQDTLGNEIGVTKRTIFVEKANKTDYELLKLEDYDSVVVVVNRTFDDKGILFEFTESRHNPAYFVYND